MEEVSYKKLFEIPPNRNCFVAFVNLLELATFFIGRKMSKGPLIPKSQGALNVQATLAVCYFWLSLIYRHRLMVFENRVRRKIFGRKDR
jgi:F0F1-type ATP synthase membrane subunit a